MKVRSLLVVTAVLGSACSTDNLTSLDNKSTSVESVSPNPISIVLDAAYGFTPLAGNSQAFAITNGIHGPCQASGAGTARYSLCVTQKIRNTALNALAQGASVTVNVPTRIVFSQKGDYDASETITASGPGGTIGTTSQTEHRTDPGKNPITVYLASFPVTAASLSVGSTLNVVDTAALSGALGASCGTAVGGMVKWYPSFAVLRITP